MRREYLLTYGTAGDFGRFAAPPTLTCRRGELAVVRSMRGLELGTVLCEAGGGHAGLLHQPAGELLRRATDEDRRTARQMRERGSALFADARNLAHALGLPLQILDIELLLDGRHVVVSYLQAADADPRELLDRLAERHGVLVSLRDLAVPPDPEEDDLASCGSGNCGSGGCGSCGSGGCSTCTHHHAAPVPHVEPAGRVPLFST
jgi:cell fate regulator YaaT (PSP1 superfamily)